jgi:hypothetical protein
MTSKSYRLRGPPMRDRELNSAKGKLKPPPAAGRTENQPEAPPGMAVPRQAQTHPITTLFHSNPLAGFGAPLGGRF